MEMKVQASSMRFQLTRPSIIPSTIINISFRSEALSCGKIVFLYEEDEKMFHVNEKNKKLLHLLEFFILKINQHSLS